jgi:hypothetical protein
VEVQEFGPETVVQYAFCKIIGQEIRTLAKRPGSPSEYLTCAGLSGTFLVLVT